MSQNLTRRGARVDDDGVGIFKAAATDPELQLVKALQWINDARGRFAAGDHDDAIDSIRVAGRALMQALTAIQAHKPRRSRDAIARLP